jgi:hypothetical protein
MNKPTDVIEVFRARCEARAQLYGAGDLNLHEAVDELQDAAVKLGLVKQLGQDQVQWIMAKAFLPYRDDLP